MLAVSPVPSAPFFPLFSKPSNRPISIAVSANSQPSRHRSYANRKQQQQQQIREQDRESRNQLSGLDVLWAMQRAAAEKNRASGGRNKKNRKREESPSLSAGGQREEYGLDYKNVRPLLIKNEWGARLDELEKRLQELSQTK